MLRLPNFALSQDSLDILSQIQSVVDKEDNYNSRVEAARREWRNKISNSSKRAAFGEVRSVLSRMCLGNVRCAYCEDSEADEIEHISPKSHFPEKAFIWENYLFSCGLCNRPKSDKYGYVEMGSVKPFLRNRGALLSPPPSAPPAFINPRIEDPLDFFEVDLGGTAPNGMKVIGTFELLPRPSLTRVDFERAQFTINVLDLNREIARACRQNAFSGFRSRLFEYVERKKRGCGEKDLVFLINDIFKAPHLTVFEEIKRQRLYLPEINDLIKEAPEILSWKVSTLEA